MLGVLRRPVLRRQEGTVSSSVLVPQTEEEDGGLGVVDVEMDVEVGLWTPPYTTRQTQVMLTSVKYAPKLSILHKDS